MITAAAIQRPPNMPFQKVLEDLFVWSDACNVYVLRDGEHALLIDLGDGLVLDRLGEIGVRHAEWVLFTHHHREQCLGAAKLAAETQVGGPEAERALFESPQNFRSMKPTLGDAHSVYGSSYARPPITPVKLHRGFATMDSFTWRGREIWCLDTRGNSPGSMSYLLKIDGRWIAFSGDLMLAGSRMHNWFDSEWDYGLGKGIYALHNSAAQLEDFEPALLCPSHGPVIRQPGEQLRQYQLKLRELERHYLRGYELSRFAGADQDRVSQPTSVPHLWQITPHLLKFKGPDYWPNFTMLLADSGKALVFDCGLFDVKFLDKTLKLMKERLGLKQIEALLVTHYHGDHALEAPYLKETWGAKVWTHERVADKLENPLRYNLAAPINSYKKELAAVKVDRVLRDGEAIQWEGYTITCDWMPGQTEHHCCYHATIDNKRVAFTGDNIFANPRDANQTGHEAVVSRNSGVIDETYIYAADYLHSLGPDIMVGGHSWVMGEPRDLIERYRQGALALRASFVRLLGEDYRYLTDVFLLRPEPYRVSIARGASAEVNLYLRNYSAEAEAFRIDMLCPPGITVDRRRLEGQTPAGEFSQLRLKLSVEAGAAPGLKSVAFDLWLEAERLGPWYDLVVQVG